jgi:hypothetical protein
MKQAIKTRQQYMNSVTHSEVETEKCEVPFIDGRVGKLGKFWYVWEYTTGRPITGVGFKTKKSAVSEAVNILNGHGKDVTERAIKSFPKLNNY